MLRVTQIHIQTGRKRRCDNWHRTGSISHSTLMDMLRVDLSTYRRVRCAMRLILAHNLHKELIWNICWQKYKIHCYWIFKRVSCSILYTASCVHNVLIISISPTINKYFSDFSCMYVYVLAADQRESLYSLTKDHKPCSLLSFELWTFAVAGVNHLFATPHRPLYDVYVFLWMMKTSVSSVFLYL